MSPRGSSRPEWLAKYGYPFIPNNKPSQEHPYIIKLFSVGASQGGCQARIIRTDGITIPRRIPSSMRVGPTFWVYVGKTKLCSFRENLPDILACRDWCNAVHQVRLGKRPVTPELLASAPSPELKQELIEACCLAAL